MNIERTPFLESLAKEAGFNLDNADVACCIKCGQRFSNNNTHTLAGWKETQITGLCEDCFDGIFSEE